MALEIHSMKAIFPENEPTWYFFVFKLTDYPESSYCKETESCSEGWRSASHSG